GCDDDPGTALREYRQARTVRYGYANIANNIVPYPNQKHPWRGQTGGRQTPARQPLPRFSCSNCHRPNTTTGPLQMDCARLHAADCVQHQGRGSVPENQVQIAIVGAGPAGLSAAAHAATQGISHVLLEGTPHIANTIQRYQKGKHVMAEPGFLPLRSDVPFEPGSREDLLAAWQDAAQQA